jgi:hypothetical protein
MRRAGILLVAVAAALLATTAVATASPAVPIELSESINFVRPPGEPAGGTFTLTGLSVCQSGTFVDEFVTGNSQFTHILVERHYTCADGAGTFSALNVLTLEPDFAAGTEAVSGAWVIRGGTGDLANLRGAGRTEGVNVACNPRCTGGSSTVDAMAHLH